MVVSPRWSPTGRHVAFVDNQNAGMVDGGILLVVASDTGALTPQQQPLFAESNFAWAPDGTHIAWVNARSDVSPVDINVAAVEGTSTPVAADTNAYSVTYGRNGQIGRHHLHRAGRRHVVEDIQVLDAGSSEPRTTVTGVATAVQGPVRGAGDSVAYLGTAPEKPLVVTDLDNRNTKMVDTEVNSFAWAPRSR